MVETKTVPPPGAGRQAQHTPAVRLSGGGKRRWRWLVLALTLTTAGALSGVLALERLDERTGVIVADTDLPAGHVLALGDLRIAEMSVANDVAMVPASQMEGIVGQSLVLPVLEGGILPENVLGSQSEFPEPDSALVGATLSAGRYPASLGAGASVSVVVTDEAQTESEARAYLALVHSIVPGPGVEGAVTVELLVGSADAAHIASASTTDRISLVQVHPRGGR